MSDAPNAWKILHVGRAPEPVSSGRGWAPEGTPPSTVNRISPSSAADVERWLVRGASRIENCDNVYLALARLLRPTGHRYRAAVVCVDGVAGEEMEFFSLLAQQRTDLDVLVYSRCENSGAVAAALQRGAVPCSAAGLGRAVEKAEAKAAVHETAEVAPRPMKAAESATAPIAPELIASTPVEPAAPAPHSVPRIAEFSEETLPEQNGHGAQEDSPSEEASRGPVRVPWVRYADAPTRRKPPTVLADKETVAPAPQAGIPAPREDSTPQRADESPDPFAPLLTEEELRALMSDDFSDLGENERKFLLGDAAERTDEGR